MNEERYFSFRKYLEELFGEPVWRASIDAGLNCPNRDGTIGSRGCLYCSDSGAAALGADRACTILDQVQSAKAALRKKREVNKFIAYFQAFTNTYGPVEKLRPMYEEALSDPEIVALYIGTRPDCLPDPIIDMLADFAERVPVWLELGLQSVHDKTLNLINRGHDFACFSDAVLRLRERGIKSAAHVILGLPGEDREMMLETARALADLDIDGIKIHLLHVLYFSDMEEFYQQGRVRVLDQREYVNLVCDFLELLPPRTVIMRLTGEAVQDTLIAPRWAVRKHDTINQIKRELIRRDSGQGSKYSR